MEQPNPADESEVRFQTRLQAEKLASLAEFAAGAGHEINNPLAVIAGRAQLLARDEADPERRRELVLIRTQALRVHEMIADMMLFARPPEPRFQALSIRHLVSELIAEFEPLAAERNTLVRYQVAEDVPVIEADPVQLKVALRAVCDNALQALGREGQIELTVKPTSDGIEIVIRDNGPGIPPEVRRHLFDPFYSGRQAGRGLGFGLSKCWRIVTAHSGTIDAHSHEGRGAEFVIRLNKVVSGQ